MLAESTYDNTILTNSLDKDRGGGGCMTIYKPYVKYIYGVEFALYAYTIAIMDVPSMTHTVLFFEK